MKRFWGRSVCLVVVLSTLPVASATGAASANRLQKMFYLKGIFSDRLVCYFAHRPSFDLQSAQSSGKRKQATIAIQTNLDTAICKDALERCNAPKNQTYHLSVANEAGCMHIAVAYDPQKIGIDCRRITSKNDKHGIIVQFNHKKRLGRLNERSNPLHRLASGTRTPHIVIDCGHGDSDTGTIGCGGVQEKEVNRSVGMHLASLLRKRGYNVFLTRKDDEHVALEERVLFANREISGDLFVSIHANAAANVKASGIETFYCSDSVFSDPLFTDTPTELSEKSNSFARDKGQASQLFADYVQRSVLDTLATQQYRVNDRRAKQEPFRVLLGTDMPAVLVELGFLTNEQEAQRLQDTQYQSALAEGISRGIASYVKFVQHA